MWIRKKARSKHFLIHTNPRKKSSLSPPRLNKKKWKKTMQMFVYSKLQGDSILYMFSLYPVSCSL